MCACVPLWCAKRQQTTVLIIHSMCGGPASCAYMQYNYKNACPWPWTIRTCWGAEARMKHSIHRQAWGFEIVFLSSWPISLGHLCVALTTYSLEIASIQLSAQYLVEWPDTTCTSQPNYSMAFPQSHLNIYFTLLHAEYTLQCSLYYLIALYIILHRCVLHACMARGVPLHHRRQQLYKYGQKACLVWCDEKYMQFQMIYFKYYVCTPTSLQKPSLTAWRYWLLVTC